MYLCNYACINIVLTFVPALFQIYSKYTYMLSKYFQTFVPLPSQPCGDVSSRTCFPPCECKNHFCEKDIKHKGSS